MFKITITNAEYFANVSNLMRHRRYMQYSLQKAAMRGVQAMQQVVAISELPREVKSKLAGSLRHMINLQTQRVYIRGTAPKLDAYGTGERAQLIETIDETWKAMVEAAQPVMAEEVAQFIPRLIYDKQEV